MKKRTEALAQRLEQGARALEDFARGLTDEEWQTPVPHDGRKIGVTGDAPLTTQFVLEDHAVRHSYHHLARIKAALQLEAATL
ncbi:MAG TPA: hypothetical protein VF105_08520 [Gemmatimonadaceae bacterium]